MRQIKTLKELLDLDSLRNISNVVRKEISTAHPNSDVSYVYENLCTTKVVYFEPDKAAEKMPVKRPSVYDNLCIILDTSGSIVFNGHEKSENYKAMKKGTQQAFEAGIGDGKRRDYAVINFSAGTISSGWIPKSKSNKLGSTINKVFAGGSKLNTDTLDKLSSEHETFSLIMITDGWIGNGAEVISKLKRLYDQGCDINIVYIPNSQTIPDEIIEMNEFATVYLTESPEGIKQEMKDITDIKVYRKGIKSQITKRRDYNILID